MGGVSDYVTFAGIAVLLVTAPGPNLALLLRNAPLLGRRVGLLNTLGFAIAILCHATLSLAGVSAIVLASATAFGALKLAGAAYLVYLGVTALRDAWRDGSGSTMAPAGATSSRTLSSPTLSSGAALAQRWLTNMLNPKPSMFYLAAFPQFLDPGGQVIAHGLALGALHAAVALVWYGFVVLAVERVRGVLARPSVARGLAGLTGVVMIALGARLALLRAPGG